VDLIRTLELLTQHITQALCDSAFRKVRTNERQRQWSLWALVQFWTAVILRAPPSLSHALVEVQEGRELLVPRIKASPEAFFERCRDLSWKFFAEVFRRFVKSLTESVEPRFCSRLASLRDRFTDVLVIDGSRLAAIARRLKILWNERAVVLPGCLMGVYDLFRGIPRVLAFCADAAAAEMTRAVEILDEIARETLIVGDRLYCAAAFFEELGQRGLWGLCRRNKRLGLPRLQSAPLTKKRVRGGLLTEWLVDAGSGVSAPSQRLRLIRFKQGRKVRELLTNVLDPKRLTAEEAMDLYPCRWSIERMYFDLKETLNLNRFYPANPNAVGMQVYAGALVYTAMRVAQSEVAQEAQIEPEEISPAKFFPKMAAACHAYVVGEHMIAEMLRLNPGKRLKRPSWKGRRCASVPLEAILVEPRNGHRRRRRFCKARRHWKSFSHVRGGRELT
jgi:hypothetical protein